MITICDNDEKLVDLKKYCPQLIIRLGKKRLGEKAYVRLTVARMIKKALKFLPTDMTFIINDAWRSSQTQKRIYQEFIERFKKNNPYWSQKRIIQEVEKFVAPYQGNHVSGHLTGGAIDVRLYKNGRKIPMKSRSLSYQENALSQQPKLPKYLQNNRRLMFEALQKAGLSNYPQEYWHWSYGDYYWAKRNKRKVAFYGVTKGR